ncbi:MAG: 1-deoxy-D-xylulose-5-phosphate synthase [Candidatus Wallbacteria bacterium]|nr:1-deoxy-D-xylulose-5-phosphate synthase [Candidatus Wallbacteria bacterium]
MNLLQEIKSPDDIRKLKLPELEQLAFEIRQKILETVANNGGHLAPSLGCVELAIALHYVFESPRDRIIWDVGHQAYAHKLLTGRVERFSSLRTYGGLSGFLKPAESAHDIFGAGHSSTSISAALGITVARDLNHEDHHVIAVIGDGSLTAGLAFEAMNHAGHLKKNLLVVLNDNEMSIAPNVGALSSYLLKIRNDPAYRRFKDDMDYLFNYLPPIGKSMVQRLKDVKNQLKHVVVPGAFFEELGFKYYGPIDGHDLRQLISAVRWIRKAHFPVLLHVNTIKGKGYKVAENNPEIFHGVGRFDIASGKLLSGEDLSYTSVFGRTIVRIAEQNPKVLAITAAMPLGTGLSEFREKFPDRYFDVGICEQHAVTFAAGLAREGFRPVVAIYTSFIQRSYDQIIHDVALQKLPVIFALDRGGLVGQDGPTHHGTFDLSFLRTVPGLVIAVPRNATQLKNLLYTAVGSTEKPFAIRYPRGSAGIRELDTSSEILPVGRGEIVVAGSDFLVIALGRMVENAQQAVASLTAGGKYGTLLNPIFLKPIDEDLLLSEIRKHQKVITVEENTIIGGLGSAVLELMARHGLKADMLTLGVPDEFVQHGTVEELLHELGLDAEGIEKSIRKFIEE